MLALRRHPCFAIAGGEFNNRASHAGEFPLTARKGSKAERYRLPEDWIIQRHNEIKIVPDELHEQIWQRQRTRLVRRAEHDGEERKKLVDRPLSRPNSYWPLIGAIYDHATSVRLAGHRCGPEQRHRYYMVQKDRTNPDSSTKWKRKFFPAEAVERAVLQTLTDVLADVEDLRPVVTDFALQRTKARAGDVGKLDELRAQRQKLAEKKACALDDFDDLGPELLRRKVGPLTAQIATLTTRIAEAEQQFGERFDAPEVVEAVLRQLRDVEGLLGEPTSAALRAVLNVLTRTVVDFENREAHIEVRLPEATLNRPDGLKGMCAVLSSAHKTQHATQPSDALVLAKYRCSRTTINRRPCMKCQRVAA